MSTNYYKVMILWGLMMGKTIVKRNRNLIISKSMIAIKVETLIIKQEAIITIILIRRDKKIIKIIKAIKSNIMVIVMVKVKGITINIIIKINIGTFIYLFL